MKTRLSLRRRASALVIVLGCLVLLSILVVAFFASVSTERKSAQSYANSSSVKLLAESTVNVVMGQIKEATKGTDSTGNTLAWASQPGMIRTYNSQGLAEGYYKLYSWSGMIGSGAFSPFAAGETPPADWMNRPAQYTDLNSPVSGVYPIVNPSAAGVVQGFSISGSAPVSANDAAPMPVQWLYVLKDGTMATGTGSGTTVTVPGASAANPIVSRIAFWTDDDTAKININTAAGDVWAEGANPPSAGNPGSFWDMPRINSAFEKTCLAKNQPAQNEFQRYPGHPATTYLSAVFANLTPANIAQIAARVASGGSQSGTAVAAASITPDSDRLYASVDELLYTASRAANPVVTPSALEQAKFFLSAHSRAPEVNLYNKPRIVTWPVSSGTTAADRSAYDRLIANCGTLNGNTYFFQRKDSTSPTNDLPAAPASSGLGRNRSLITYLRDLTSQPIPGFSTSASQTFLQKYPLDRDQILTEIFDYIRALNAQDTSGAITSFTPSAAGTGTVGKGQIVPIVDDTHADSNSATLRGFGRFPTVRSASLLFIGVGQTSGTNKSVPPSTTQAPALAIADGMTRVQAVFLLNLFDPSQGYGASSPNFQVRVSGLNGFTWTNAGGTVAPMGFAAAGTARVNLNQNTGIYGGYKGASSFIGVTPAFVSSYVDLPTTSGTNATAFAFGGGTATVEILNSAAAGGGVLQTLKIPFPGGTFPVPELAPLLKDVSGVTNILNIDFRDTRAGAFTAPPAVVARFSGAANPGGNTSASASGKMFICGKDVVRSVEAITDLRTIAAMAEVPASCFGVEARYFSPAERQVHSIAEAANGAALYPAIGAKPASLAPSANYGAPATSAADFTYSAPSGDPLQPVAAPSGSVQGYHAPMAFGVDGSGNGMPVNGVYAGTNKTGSAQAGFAPGDWDTGFSIVPDGAFINKADEGTIIGLSDGTQTPYFTALNNYKNAGSTFFSPSRQMPSAVMFGSLPTGVFTGRPWQTLLFRPDPDGQKHHTGAQSPPDYLLLDLFNMPIVEPYAISDPFSTAGKININTQIVPFTYLTRDTAVRAVLRPEQILALSASDAATYKLQGATIGNKRNFLDLDETMKGLQERFATGEIFRSASEICSIWLVPRGQTYAGMPAYWTANELTGDNVRERPYANIYPRLTTKSNTYTVHYRVQALKKLLTTPPDQWVENKDAVVGEYRGSSTLERYLDTGDKTIPDYATASNPDPIDRFYKFRVLETKQFTP